MDRIEPSPGDIIIIGKAKYEVHTANELRHEKVCILCAFNKYNCDFIQCTLEQRKDKKNVYLKRL